MRHRGKVINPDFVGEPGKIYDCLKYYRTYRKPGDGNPPERDVFKHERHRMYYTVPVYIKTDGFLFKEYFWESDSIKYKEILSKYPDAIDKRHGTVPFWKSFKQGMQDMKSFILWYVPFVILFMIIVRTYLGTW